MTASLTTSNLIEFPVLSKIFLHKNYDLDYLHIAPTSKVDKCIMKIYDRFGKREFATIIGHRSHIHGGFRFHSEYSTLEYIEHGAKVKIIQIRKDGRRKYAESAVMIWQGR